MTKLLFLHGYESSGKGFKAQFLRECFPKIYTPTFSGELEDRMEQLDQFITETDPSDQLAFSESTWTIIGSSFGGLMASYYAFLHPQKVSRLILLAPALIKPFYPAVLNNASIEIPTLIIHGQEDDVVPLPQVLFTAQNLFKHLEFRLVKDNHRLHQTVQALDWDLILSPRNS